MENPNKNLQIEKERLLVLADELEEMQANQNNGRGVSAVQSVVFYLRQGDLESAVTVALTDNDKIRSYPEIHAYLLEKGLREKEFGEK